MRILACEQLQKILQALQDFQGPFNTPKTAPHNFFNFAKSCNLEG